MVIEQSKHNSKKERLFPGLDSPACFFSAFNLKKGAATMKKEITGFCENGKKCVYVLPEFINSAGKMRAFEISRCGKNKIPELSYQPSLLGCVGPFFDGYTCGGSVAVIRYEKKY